MTDPTQAQAEGEELPELPRPAVCFADHSYPAFSARQMQEYARLALSRRAPPAAPSQVAGYALRDTSSGTVEVASGLFRRREAAEAAALRLTNQWKTIGVLPLQIALGE